MTLRRIVFILVTTVLALTPALRATQSPASQALAALIQERSRSQLSASRSPADNPSLSLAAAERAADDARAFMAKLDGIDDAGLSHQERLSREFLKWNAWVTINQVPQFWYHTPLIPTSGAALSTFLTSAPEQTFSTGRDLDAYLADLERLAATIDAAHAKERGRAERGIILPDEMVDRTLTYLDAFAADPDTSVFAVRAERLSALPAADVAAFQGRVAAALDTRVVPAARALQNTLRALAPKAPNAVGWGQYPGGRDAYRIAVRQMTTLDITPEEVHRLGLAFVAEAEREMTEIRKTLGFTGTKAEFHERLRRDRWFYVDTPEAFGDALMRHIRRIEPRVRDFFTASPEAIYGVTRLSPALESTMTYGFYSRPSSAEPRGLYHFNGSQLEDRSLLAGAALIFHELVPGHHFQINLQAENRDLPAFRRSALSTGYTEGWGEYSSSVVAREMGMYTDPYELDGRLVFDNFFNVRLVVDTGMNFHGWSRPKAMLYMREHTLESDVQIDSETIRYSVRSPAQALAYRMGRQTFVRLREKATAALGPRFDIRRFHDAVLSVGALPLTTLEQHIDWWIARELSR